MNQKKGRTLIIPVHREGSDDFPSSISRRSLSFRPSTGGSFSPELGASCSHAWVHRAETLGFLGPASSSLSWYGSMINVEFVYAMFIIVCCVCSLGHGVFRMLFGVFVAAMG